MGDLAFNLKNLPPAPRKNRLLIAFVILSFFVTLYVAFRSGQQGITTLYAVPILGSLAIILWVKFENRPTLSTTFLGIGVGAAMVGISAIIYMTVNGLFYGTYEIQNYANAMVPSLSATAPYSVMSAGDAGLNAVYQIFVVSVCEELVFGVLLLLGLLFIVPASRTNRFALVIIFLAAAIIFAIYHSTAYGSGEGAAGMYVSAGAFRIIATGLLLSTGNVLSLFAAHGTHNIIVGGLAFSVGGAEAMFNFGIITVIIVLIIVVAYLVLKPTKRRRKR